VFLVVSRVHSHIEESGLSERRCDSSYALQLHNEEGQGKIFPLKSDSKN